MPPEEDKSKIEELKKSLYSRSAPEVRTRRKLRFFDKVTDIKKSWGTLNEEIPEGVDANSIDYEDHTMSFLKKILIGSAIFCVIAVGIGLYILLNGSNLISANNIDIVINGPVSIPGGSPVSFDVNITNRNNIDLQLVDMEVDFPAGAADPTDPSKELSIQHGLIGDIASGNSVKKTISALIFGEENTQKQIVILLTYNVKGSSSVFTKRQTYDILVNSSPVIITASSFKEITSGQEFDLEVTVKSNSQEMLKNVLVKGSYPFGFTFLSSDIKPTSGNTIWRIGDLPAGGEKKIIIHGKLEGQDTESRVFRFTIGAQSSTNSSVIGTEYGTTQQEVTIQKPFVSLAISVDGNLSSIDHVTRFKENNRVEISWFNNLQTSVANVVITAKLSGSAYDKFSTYPYLGYFRSDSNEIIWDQKTNPELALVAPGDTGTVSFTVIPKDLSTTNRTVTNPTITVNASVAGDRNQESGVSESLSSIVSRNLRITSNVYLTGKIVRNSGLFQNSGPIPPQAEKETTYTIVWTVDNTYNNVGAVQVTSSLPPYVKWLSSSPQNEDISYNPDSGQIVWNVGSISTHTSGTTRRREVAFQVSFLPSVTQIGTAPILINRTSLTAVDSFTGAKLESVQDYLTTRFSTDPSYKEGQETVVK